MNWFLRLFEKRRRGVVVVPWEGAGLLTRGQSGVSQILVEETGRIGRYSEVEVIRATEITVRQASNLLGGLVETSAVDWEVTE